MSQETKILQMLRKAGQHGIPNYRFPEARILRYSARIGDLRKEGWNIIAERQRLSNGRTSNVWRYILIEERKPNLLDKFKKAVSK